ncbi:hypothetical protein V6N12_072411 [Hibiscus sabdariffa]|uniref:Protein HIRA n=1 Tax=Hibiscus sabdariffa TaxID=183260 RepID=A0ABR2FND1_9ROSI
MIAEKPSWVRHEGMQIFSIDVRPGGLRFATGGGDHKVRIWNLESVARDLENDESTQRLLATLNDHFGSVNCVRWAKHGRFAASGSDDQVILIHERKPGSGTTEFGSGELPDVENWKVAMTLRDTRPMWWILIAVLRGHSSLIKGVAWDPIGSFIASQSDDKTVLIWRTSDWSLAHRTEGHWAKSLGSTFFRRLGWSPCGHFITTTHGYQKPRHSAPVLERGEWAASFDFLGHNAPVIVVKFNHSMFRRNFANSQEVKAAPVDWANGAAKIGGKESQPYNVIAIGSQDSTVTVWTTASPRPLFVAKHFFGQSVVDLSWSSDGYSLFACSLDGTVATFHFEAKELGHRLSDAELDELKKSCYGDIRGQQANLAESSAQLLLEAASAKQSTGKKVPSNVQQNQIPAKPSVELGIKNKIAEPQNDDGKKSGLAVSDGLNKAMSPARISSPVKQREYRRTDGRKRIIPEVVGVPSQQENICGNAQSPALDFPVASSDHRKNEHSGVTARATVTDSLVIEKVLVSAGQDHGIDVEKSGSMKPSASSASSTTSLSIRVFDKKEGNDMTPVCLEACLSEHAVNDIAGVGHATTFIDCDESWKLLLVTRKGSLYLWDLFNRNCLLHDSLASLISLDLSLSAKGTIKLISAKLSKSGYPLVVLATRHAFLFDMSLMCWLRVADDCFPASNFASSWSLGSVQTGELAARKYLARKPGWSRVTDNGVQTRAHLEAQLASSLALESPNEYRQGLLSYICFLAREADESGLREVCESFLGPPTGMASDSKNPAWDPYVLRLLNEFMDLLSEYQSVENILDQKTHLHRLYLSQPVNVIGLMDSTPSAAAQTDSPDLATHPPPSADKMGSAPINRSK